MELSYNYWCEHCTCGKIGKEKDFVVDLTEEEAKEPIYCPNSEEPLPMKQLGYKPVGGFLRFSGTLISKEDKQKFLMKRSHEDYKKNIEEVKMEKHKAFIRDAKSIFGK